MDLPMNYQMSVMEIQVSRSFDICHAATKVFQMPTQSSLKLTCAVISLFNKSVKVTTEKMNGLEIYESSIMFCEKYTHESVSDLMLCLKMAKAGELGVIYNRFDTVTLFEFFRTYLDLKWARHERNLFAQKTHGSGSVNTEHHTSMHVAERKENAKKTDSQWKEAVRVQTLIDAKRFEPTHYEEIQ